MGRISSRLHRSAFCSTGSRQHKGKDEESTHDLQNARRRTKWEYWSFFLSASTSTLLAVSLESGMYVFARSPTMTLISSNDLLRAWADSMSASTARRDASC